MNRSLQEIADAIYHTVKGTQFAPDLTEIEWFKVAQACRDAAPQSAPPEALRSEPTAWAIFASDTHEMIDLSLIEPDEAPGQYVEPLFAVSPLRQSQEKT